MQRPHPPIYFGGSSPAGQAVAAKHSDVYLTWGEPPAQVEQKINEVRKLAENRRKKGPFWYSTTCNCKRNGGRSLE